MSGSVIDVQLLRRSLISVRSEVLATRTMAFLSLEQLCQTSTDSAKSTIATSGILSLLRDALQAGPVMLEKLFKRQSATVTSSPEVEPQATLHPLISENQETTKEDTGDVTGALKDVDNSKVTSVQDARSSTPG